MTLAELHPALREALAAHEGLRRLGFLPDQIFLNPNTTDQRLAVCVVRGGREAAILAGVCSLPDPVLITTWAESTKWWNHEATPAEQDEIFQSSKFRRGAVHVVASLVSLGFNVRRADA